MSVITEGNFWANELRDLSPDVRYLIWKSLGSRLDPDQYERLVERQEEDDDGDEDTVFACPNCNYPLSFDEITVAQRSDRNGEVTDFDPEEMTLGLWFGDAEDYETVAYECGNCSAPVSPPAGWSVID